MPSYKVHVAEVIRYELEVEADSEEAACEMAEKLVIDAADRFERFDGELRCRQSWVVVPEEDW